jgi:anaerobic magnesium-protoporphyrin IX monomethyl ester cyclase
VESFNDEILKYIRKGLTVEQIYRGIEWLKKYSVPVKLNILIGTSPMETPKTIKETVDEARKLDVSQVMINIVAPFPGTEFYSLARKNGWILGGDYVPTDVQHESILNYPNLSNKQMTRILRHSNMRFFLRPSIVWQHVRQFRSLSDFVAALKAFKIKLFG